MTLRQLYPVECNTTANNILTDITSAAKTPLPIASPLTREFCTDLSHALLEDERALQYPELAALGFWLRPSSIAQILRDYVPSLHGIARMPIGTVFQIPPSNVDTLFGYTAIISLLCGNITLIRLSSKARTVQQTLVTLMADCLTKADPILRNRLFIVRYDHDATLTAGLSANCDLRLVWGGDATVSDIRAVPLPPLAREISFADRFSCCAIESAAYLLASEKDKEDVAHRFATDIYLFDQRACSSPRLLLWIGSEENANAAAADLYKRLALTSVACRYDVDASVNLTKLTSTYLALHDLSVERWDVHSPALTTVTLSNLDQLSNFKRVNYGFGLLLAARLDKLSDYAPSMDQMDQTFAYWGFQPMVIRNFAEENNGRGFVNYAPIGQATGFDPVWDGVNLFDAMTRLVRVNAP